MDMRGLLLICLGLTFSIVSGQSWRWAKKQNTTGFQTATKVCADQTGGVFIIGSQESSSTVDGQNISTGNFLLHYDKAGALIWQKHLGFLPAGITCDSDENIFLYGNYYDTIRFENATLISRGISDVYLLKLDKTGNLIWGKSFGGVNEDYCSAISVNKQNEILLTGFFNTSTQFGTFSFNRNQYNHLFVMKIGTNGNIAWAKDEPSFYASNGLNIAMDGLNRIWISGRVAENCTDCVKSYVTVYSSEGELIRRSDRWGLYECIEGITSNGNSGVFILVANPDPQAAYAPYLEKIDENLVSVWKRTLGGQMSDYCLDNAVHSDGSGNVIVSGMIRQQFPNQDSVYIHDFPVCNEGGFDCVITKFDAAGNVSWARCIGGNKDQVPVSFAINSTSEVTFVGRFNMEVSGSSSVSDSLKVGNDVLVNDGDWPQLFIARLDESSISVNKQQASERILLYPNPAQDLIFISGAESNDQIEIRSSSGTVVYSKNYFSNQLDLSSLESGVYFISITGKKEKEVRKLIIN